jgi:hypothetical protein
MTNVPRDPVLYAKVVETIKARVQRWPSAYASGMVVREYKRMMLLEGREPYYGKKTNAEEMNPLTRWFKEKWIDIATGKPCGRKKEEKHYPTCRPTVKISNQTPLLASQLSESNKKKLTNDKQIAKKNKITFPKK